MTCQKMLIDCAGHYGYIKLNLPLYHIGFFKKIVNILQSVCKNCSRLLISDEKIRKQFSQSLGNCELTKKISRFKKVVEECKKTKECPHCKMKAGKVKKLLGFSTKILYTIDKNAKDVIQEQLGVCSIRANMKEQIEASVTTKTDAEKVEARELNPVDALELFRSIKDSDAKLLMMETDIQRPEDLIVEYVIAPPLNIRPSVKVGGDKTNEDDMTVKIYEILKQNQHLGKCMKDGYNMSRIMEAWNLLQNIYTQFINSETSGLPRDMTGSNSTRGIVQRLKGKTGRFRGNLSGKRVEFSGRTVITPDPNLRIDQVIVPKQMAYILTLAEVVNSRNMKRMKEAVKNGPERYPGANYITVKGDTVPKSLAFLREKKVHESLSIGDIVHRHLLKDDIILFNRQPSLHKLSIMAFRAVIKPSRTLRFNECVCNPFNADFDGDEMNIHLPQTEEARTEAIALMGSFENILNPKAGNPIITFTQDFLTCAFLATRKDYFMDRGQFCKYICYFSDADEHIILPPPAIIKPVELWTGKQLMTVLISPNTGVQPIVNLSVIEKSYDSDEKRQCMDENDGYVIFKNSELICGNLGKATLGGSKNGLIYALLKDNSRYVAAQVMCRLAKFSARWLTNYGMTLGLTDVTPDITLTQYKKTLIEEEFAKCDEIIESYKQGKLTLKTGCNPEETLETDMSKILNDIREEAGKYCLRNLPFTNSALKMAICGSKGSKLNLCQMIACVGQQSVSGERIPNGFTNRSLPHFDINSKEPKSRGFVSNSFFTGLTPPEFFFHTMGGREGLIDTAVKTADTGYMQRRLIKALEDVVVSYDGSVRNSEGTIVQFVYGDDGLDPNHTETEDFPFNLNRLISYCKSFYPPKAGERLLSIEEIKLFHQMSVKDYKKDRNLMLVDRYYLYLEQFVDEYCQKITHYDATISSACTDSAAIKPNFSEFSTTKRQIQLFFRKLKHKIICARIVPGEGIGATSAQSIGEPCTQMTLKTFHFAGIASMDVTQGVPRIKEIINASENIATPIIEVVLRDPYDAQQATFVKNKINVVFLKDICESICEVYESEGCYIEIKFNRQVISSKYNNLSIRKVRHAIIKGKIKVKDKQISDDDGSFRLRIEPYDTDEREMIFVMKNLLKKLPNLKVGGIPTIKRALIKKEEKGDKEIYKIFAEGMGLDSIFTIPEVNYVDSITNHILEVNNVLGIEAARVKIIEQINETIGKYAINVNIRHINVLADVMTGKGKVLGITRYGIAKMKDSTLMLASFEKTADILFDAAYFSKEDHIKGVSENIIVGSQMSIGTGAFSLLYDTDIKKKKRTRKSKRMKLKKGLIGIQQQYAK